MTGAQLAAIRKAAGLSQAELAQRAGCGRHAISYWECKPEIDRRAWAVERIARVLDLPYFATPKRARTEWADRMEAREQALASEIAELVARQDRARAVAAARRRVRCGARTRKGTPCRALSEPGKKRCKFHGGKSTGARTPEGKERIAEAQRQRWARWRANQTAE